MSCTKEEIERKRLAALQRRSSHLSTSSPHKPYPSNTSSPSTSSDSQFKRFTTKSNTNYGHKSYHPYVKPDTNTGKETSVPVDKVISGTIYLTSEERFEVNPSEFCTPLINIFKSLPSKNYDPKSKLWNFSLDDYPELMAKVAPLSPHVVLGSIPASVLKLLKEPTVDPSSVDLSPVEPTLRNKLMPFQEEGVRFGIAKRGRCLIADDMGLGKTFQALGIASYYRHNWPLLIVTTSSMRETWQSKIHELLPSVPMMNIACLTTNRDAQLVADRQTEVVVCSYKLVSSHTQLLKNKKFGVVIVDESHYLKSHRAQCTLAISSLCRAAARLVLLSGTPALSRPVELYTQLQLIQPAFLTYNEYGKRYCAGRLTTFGWDMSGQSNLAELNILLQRRFLIRRTKDQVLTSLESKTRESVILDESLLDFSKEDRQQLSKMASAYTASPSANRHNMLLGLFSESARAKTPAVCKYIKQLLHDDSTPKFLVFGHHRHMLDAICLTLDELGTHYICISGSTPATARAELVDRFQYAAGCRAAVLSVTAAGAGLTLTAAALVLFAELHWNPGILTQAESRAHRIGQQGGVCVRYLLAPGTVDDHIWPMLQHKLNVLNEVGLSKDTFENNTTKLQQSKNNIQQYLSPSSKNKNDYIPGTNIRKDSLYCDKRSDKDNVAELDATGDLCEIGGEFETSFLDDDEGDALLADLDL